MARPVVEVSHKAVPANLAGKYGDDGVFTLDSKNHGHHPESGGLDPATDNGISGMVTAPREWSSAPGKEPNVLAYITPGEVRDFQKVKKVGQSPEGSGPEISPGQFQHRGPEGILSFDGEGMSGGGGNQDGSSEGFGDRITRALDGYFGLRDQARELSPLEQGAMFGLIPAVMGGVTQSFIDAGYDVALPGSEGYAGSGSEAGNESGPGEESGLINLAEFSLDAEGNEGQQPSWIQFEPGRGIEAPKKDWLLPEKYLTEEGVGHYQENLHTLLGYPDPETPGLNDDESFQRAAQKYWNDNPDVAEHGYYGRGPEGKRNPLWAYRHWIKHGQFEEARAAAGNEFKAPLDSYFRAAAGNRRQDAKQYALTGQGLSGSGDSGDGGM